MDARNHTQDNPPTTLSKQSKPQNKNLQKVDVFTLIVFSL